MSSGPNPLSFLGLTDWSRSRERSMTIHFSAFMALGDGNHKLPVKAQILHAIGKAPGQTVNVTLLERLSSIPRR
jgi:hypothetical protein